MSDVPSNKPYLIRALHQWCTDFGFTPFIAVFVDSRVEVPMEYVKNNEIVLNLSVEACHQLQLENDWISFQARFGGIPRRIMVPVSHVLAVYARENGQGMSFPFDPTQARDLHLADSSDESPEKPKLGKPSLRIVK
ncbi:ClpXP protease specificity-enhancing factor [Polynucleobacter sp. MWH-UH25E]|uniref:ClpXP protease specificity-enhancing factor n=1 Tax=Polynucleobacter sp. MWH-UH25E TaxID=1855616 RepID=UPI001BFDEBBD|nr:ClpXP protease specificity-enhancing factor [Polynucleobacter sp. MWH-UH25E]QWD62175.1 ClpXP protease specificity-enhancing factor [Polynucleobacter sp. MWH-UH25E]